jgi:hypothetical protein
VGDAADRLMLSGVDPVRDRGFERRFAAVFGRPPERQAVLGYRAMRLVLAAVARAGQDAASRREVIARALALAGDPRARFARYRVQGPLRDGRGSPVLVRVGPPL